MAPHGQFKVGSDGKLSTSPPIPAARHAHLFEDIKSKSFFLTVSKYVPSYMYI